VFGDPDRLRQLVRGASSDAKTVKSVFMEAFMRPAAPATSGRTVA
jgi:hypothetical protein